VDMHPAFALDATCETDTVRVRVVGDLDLISAVALDEALRRATALRPRLVVIDISAVQFCDLAGLRALLRGHAAGAAIVDAPSCVRRLFEVTGLRQILHDVPLGHRAAVSGAAPRPVADVDGGRIPARARS
jgi:anti-sigma B factor antagonist